MPSQRYKLTYPPKGLLWVSYCQNNFRFQSLPDKLKMSKLQRYKTQFNCTLISLFLWTANCFLLNCTLWWPLARLLMGLGFRLPQGPWKLGPTVFSQNTYATTFVFQKLKSARGMYFKNGLINAKTIGGNMVCKCFFILGRRHFLGGRGQKLAKFADRRGSTVY